MIYTDNPSVDPFVYVSLTGYCDCTVSLNSNAANFKSLKGTAWYLLSAMCDAAVSTATWIPTDWHNRQYLRYSCDVPGKELWRCTHCSPCKNRGGSEAITNQAHCITPVLLFFLLRDLD
jgi:hypothetical protein